jgi:hypothetical protein
MRSLIRYVKLPKKVAAPLKSMTEMKAFVKKCDPRFATDYFLSSLSLDELVEYYQSCVDALSPRYRDDWDERLLCAQANNR